MAAMDQESRREDGRRKKCSFSRKESQKRFVRQTDGLRAPIGALRAANAEWVLCLFAAISSIT
jgi:hypothetical protein